MPVQAAIQPALGGRPFRLAPPVRQTSQSALDETARRLASVGVPVGAGIRPGETVS